MLKPANTSQGVIHIDVTVTFTRSAAVAPGHDVQAPIAIDVRDLQARHAVRREPPDEMCGPCVTDALGLLEPIEPPASRADDVESAIPIQIRVLQVESGSPGTVDANGVLTELEVTHVLEEHQPVLATGSGDDVQISVAVEIHRFGVLRHAVLSEIRCCPVVTDKRVAGHLIDGHGGRPREVLGSRPLSALVRGGGLGYPVTVEIGEEHANIGATSLGHGKDQTRPSHCAGAGTWILQIDEMCQLGRHHHIEIPIAVDVGDGGIFRGGCVGSFGQGDVDPAVWVRRTERYTHVAFGVRNEVRVERTGVVFAIRFMHRDDVLVPIVVDIGHDQTIAATQLEPGGRRFVDDVLSPRDVLAVRSPSHRHRVADEGPTPGPGSVGLTLDEGWCTPGAQNR